VNQINPGYVLGSILHPFGIGSDDGIEVTNHVYASHLVRRFVGVASISMLVLIVTCSTDSD